MPINETNLKLINDLERDLKNQLIWVGRNAIDQNISAIERYRNLRQFVIGLSVAILGIVFPNIIESKIFLNNSFFVVSLAFFGILVIYGVFDLIKLRL